MIEVHLMTDDTPAFSHESNPETAEWSPGAGAGSLRAAPSEELPETHDDRDDHEDADEETVLPPLETQITFTSLGLSEPLLRALTELGFERPTPIQAEAIPVILSGKDVVASAQTGTGKTAAFALPILDLLGEHHKNDTRALILEPTRELALQVGDALRSYGKHTGLSVAVIMGGYSYARQIEEIEKGADIIVATPGRLLDHVSNRRINLRAIKITVLDEVDRMLDMGFMPDVRKIIDYCSKREQSLMFSATIPPQIENLAQWALRDDAVRIVIGRQSSPAETIDHAFYPVSVTEKLPFLVALLDHLNFQNVIIFTRTKANADMVVSQLRSLGHDAAVIHGDRTQKQRVSALNGFKEGRSNILVATDIAARGLDIANVGHVINYDVPENPEDYVHRIGRTGRAEKTGDACTILTGEEMDRMRAIEHYVGQTIPKRKLESFSYAYNVMVDQLAAGKGPGRRSGMASKSRRSRGRRRRR